MKRVVLAAVCALVTAGCTAKPAEMPIDIATEPAVPALSPEAPPTGQSAVLAQAGVGPKDFDLTNLATGSHNLTIRLRCRGDGGATVSSDARSLILSVPACAGEVVYTAAFSDPPKDHAIHLTVATATTWEFGVWAD